MSATSTHSTRTLTIPLAGNPNLLLVAGGSDGNLDVETVDKDVVRSQVRVFKIDELLAADAPLDYGEAEVLGWGLRNSVGWAEDPSTGHIVSAVFLFQHDLWLGNRLLTDSTCSGPLRTQSIIFTAATSMSITPILVRNSTSTAFPMTPPAPNMVLTMDIPDASPSTTPPTSRTTLAEQRLASSLLARRRERRIWASQMRSVRRSKRRGLRSDHTLRH